MATGHAEYLEQISKYNLLPLRSEIYLKYTYVAIRIHVRTYVATYIIILMLPFV